MTGPFPFPVKSTCAYCGVGCGIIASKDEAQKIRVEGDPNHPANLGRLCVKGAALADTLDLEGRLLHPEIDHQPVDWDTALAKVAGDFKDVIETHGPDAVAFYVSGQLLTEDYYVANKLMKGFIGSANIDTNSRLCMSSSVAGHKRAFGSDTVPGCYEDIEQADLVVLTGSNMAWCHPVLYQRLATAKEANPLMKVVVIDPRRTASSDIADLHLAIKPGADAILFNGLLTHLDRQNKIDVEFASNHCDGLDKALVAAERSAPNAGAVGKACGLSLSDINEFYELFEVCEKSVTLYSQGINQSSSGTDKVNAILNCHLATGRIGRPGMGPFSLTGQPNAMGGREVGGLANQLAAHMEITNPDHRDLVARFWGAPDIADKPGLAAIELFEAVEAGKVKAIWIMGTNPAVSLPDNSSVRGALEKCELVVVSDCERNTDTAAYADVLLPALAWGEKNGTVTNSERRISRQRAFLPAPGEARPDWWIISEVARRLGYEAEFNYESSADIFREHAALSGFENDGRRDFEISGYADLDLAAYDKMQPRQWPVTKERPQGTPRLFADGGFYRSGEKAALLPVDPQAPVHAPDVDFPLILNTGRIRDHWHTMTRTGKSARLSAQSIEPFAEIHPQDATRFEVSDGALARLETSWGNMIARVKVTTDQQPGSIFVPMHWNNQFASHGLADALVNPVTDPISLQPELKHTPVRIAPFEASWHAFVLTRDRLDVSSLANIATYWVAARGQGFWHYELAGEQIISKTDLIDSLFSVPAIEGNRIEFEDTARGSYRGAHLIDDRLENCLFVSSSPNLPARDWLKALFTEAPITEPNRASLLMGVPPAGQKEAGTTVCACFGIGINTIINAITDESLTSVEEIGAALSAGTNCGSCVPELKNILTDATTADHQRSAA